VTRFILVSCMLVSGVAGATIEVGGGLVDEIDGTGSELLTVSYLTDHQHPWEFMLGHIFQRPSSSIVPTPGVDFVSVSRRLTWRSWFASAGLAWVSADNEVLSGHGQFHTGAGWRGERWSISLRHLSNANTGGRNRGETFVLAQFGF
jgi:hypothetical protein